MKFVGSQLKNLRLRLFDIEIEKMGSKMFEMQNTIFEVRSLRGNVKTLKS